MSVTLGLIVLFLILATSALFPTNNSKQGTSSPPCGKSDECLLLPVISHVIVPPRWRNSEHTGYFPRQVSYCNDGILLVPVPTLVFKSRLHVSSNDSHCISILNVTGLTTAFKFLSYHRIPNIFIDMMASHATWKSCCPAFLHLRPRVSLFFERPQLSKEKKFVKFYFRKAPCITKIKSDLKFNVRNIWVLKITGYTVFTHACITPISGGSRSKKKWKAHA